jgi:hypothetical protein
MAFALRNVKLVGRTATHRPLDDLMARADQDHFVEHGNRPEWEQEPRDAFPLLHVRSRPKRRQFDGEIDRAQALRSFMRTLVLALVPRPWVTEGRFWSLTWLGRGFVRLNVGQQELATVDMVDPEHCSVRLLAPQRLTWFAARSGYETRDFENRLSLNRAMHLLVNRAKARPVRERALWLARHTTPLNLRSHCPWLLDAEAEA